MFKPIPKPAIAELRAGGTRILAIGRNAGFPKLAESAAITRFHEMKVVGRASRLTEALEAMEMHPDRFVSFPDNETARQP